jgi:4-amino-4-deoxy-L-arabinose transferase-like glycosyltransferase
MADLRDVAHRYDTRTSVTHKRLVLLFILGAALLRGALLLLPITQAEAELYVHLAAGPLWRAMEGGLPEGQVVHGILVKLSTGFFGSGPVALRLPAYVAGLLALPLYYLVVRSVFNRYIALTALALVAADGTLTGTGALADPQPIAWSCLMLALALGRHVVRTGNLFTAVLLGAVCAISLWNLPAQPYVALTALLWLVMLCTMRSRRKRAPGLRALLLAAVVFVLGATVLLLPAWATHGAWIFVNGDPEQVPSTQALADTHMDAAYALWTTILGAAPPGVVWPGLVAFLFAGWESNKFRTLAVALLLATVPVVLLQGYIAPDHAWAFILYVLHLGTAIGLYYLLKWVHDRGVSGLGERLRTTFSALAVFALFAGWGMPAAVARIPRYPEAPELGFFLRNSLRMGDRVCSHRPWAAVVEYQALAEGLERGLFHGVPAPGGTVFVVLDPVLVPDPAMVLGPHHIEKDDLEPLEMVEVIGRTKIFAARLRHLPAEGTPAGDALEEEGIGH